MSDINGRDKLVVGQINYGDMTSVRWIEKIAEAEHIAVVANDLVLSNVQFAAHLNKK